MNIFVLHRNPVIAAQMACDKHVVKMIVETCQMLSAVRIRNGREAPYKLTHEHHPCTIWAGESMHNYAWLWKHGLALSDEYSYRYGKVHACHQYLEGSLKWVPELPRAGLTPFPQAMPEEFRDDDPVIAYRKFYIGAKARFAKWKERPEPLWFALKQPELEV